MKIVVGTLKDQREELAAFLEPRLGAKPEVTGDALEVEDGAMRAGVKPRDVKTYIKRFMYMKGVRKRYRVFVAGKELTIQEIEQGEKEEEEEEKKKGKKEEESKQREQSTEAKPTEGEESEPGKEEGDEKPKEEKPAKKSPKKPRSKKPAKKEEDNEDDKDAEENKATGSAQSA